MWENSLNIELISTGLVGLFTVGLIAKKAFDGYVEARSKIRAQEKSPMMAMASSVWDRDQQERFIAILSDMRTAFDAMALSLGALASKQTQDMNDTLQHLVEQVEGLQKKPAPRRRRPAKRSTKSTT